MTDSKISRWVKLQQRTWDCDEGCKASRICLERPGGEKIYEWHANADDLVQMIEDGLKLQAEELPHGAHQFRLVAYGGDNNAQLSELPQTVRGISKDATSAASEAIALQRASHLALQNFDFACTRLREEMEKQSQRLADQIDNTTQLLERCVEMQGKNFSQELDLAKFNKHQERLDILAQCLTPILTMVIEKYAPKFLGVPASVVTPPAAPPAPAVPPANSAPPVTENQQTDNVNRPSEEPDHEPGIIVSKSRQDTLSPSTQERPERDGGHVHAEHSRQVAKRVNGSRTAKPTQPKRKQVTP